MGKWRLVVPCLILATMALGGCELLYFAGGKGKQPALYKFGKNEKALVLVEVREGLAPPPFLAPNLADAVTKHLWKYGAVQQPMITQDALMALQTSRPADYKKMGIADIAQATGADAVLHVFIIQFETPTTSDGTVSEGNAQAFVKVVNKDGTNVFGSKTGLKLSAHDPEAYVSDRDVARTTQDLINQLTIQTGRMFHDYDLEDAVLNPARLDPIRQMGRPGQ